MRVPIYLLCAALAVAVQCEDNPNYMDLEPVNVAADTETINYLIPKLATKYRPNNEWSGVRDPRFYVLTEMESNDVDNKREKLKKIMDKRFNSYTPTLSVQAPIQVLRNLHDRNNYQQKIFQNRRFINMLTSS